MNIFKNVHKDILRWNAQMKSEFFWITEFFFNFNFYFYFILLYNTVLVLPYIDMNPPRVYMRSQHEPPSHLPPHNIPLGHPHAPW